MEEGTALSFALNDEAVWLTFRNGHEDHLRPSDRLHSTLARHPTWEFRWVVFWPNTLIQALPKHAMTRGFVLVLAAFLIASADCSLAQSPDLYGEMQWRAIGPTRAGRTRALDGVPDQPNVFYIGFDNGGVWRSTDYGSNWVPLFDDQSTSSIGAIAVAPSNPDIIYVGSGAGIIRPDLSTGDGMYKSSDAGETWTHLGLRDSQMIADVVVDPGNPDLSRTTWEVPESAGRYADGVEVSAQGAITALSPSPVDVNVIWAGTDDGNIQVTMDGGSSWTSVTPPAIKPWTRIFNIEAGHFDKGTAYAAANTMRIDDMNPHFWRTHDGGRTWTEINTGLAPGAVANSIREDPRKPGLLYAATETQVWFSIDDGGRWQSLRLNMPATSVRDIQVKDDDTCLCSDLVAGTHGRGFWILDNVTPLRQLAEAQAASAAFLFRPATAVRVRFGTNRPTEWTPELPHGENPLPGGLIDYYLANDAAGPVTMEILDASGAVVRSLSSDDPVLEPDPALDPDGYDRICREDPSAPNCRVPLYWPAPQMVLSTRKGMHRFSWDLHYEPIGEEPRAGGGATGAVPGHTYPSVQARWAPPGEYTVRLTVAGRTFSQPLTLRLDPRVKTSAAELEHAAVLSREMYDGAVTAHAAYEEARAVVKRLPDGDLKAELEAVAPAPRPTGGRRFFRGGSARRSAHAERRE